MNKIFRILFRLFIIVFIVANVASALFAYKFTHFNDNGYNIASPANAGIFHNAKTILFDGFSKIKNDVIPDSTFRVITLTTKNNLKLEGWYLKTDSVSKG